MNSLSEIAEIIKKHDNIAICAHVFPDPDAIGSSCGLERGLAKLGKKVSVCLSEPPIDRMKEFSSASSIVYPKSPSNFDLIICVDTANKERVDAMPEVDALILNIDHHESNALWAKYNYIDSKSASCSIIIAELLALLEVPLDKEIGSLLLAGLVDDTGSFRFSNTNRKALESAAMFIDAGASTEEVANALYFTVPERRLRLQAKGLERLKLYENGTIGLISITQDILESLEATADDTDGLVDIARSLKGVLVAVFIREHAGKWKFSLRSKSKDLSVNKVAAEFGGGGHPAAAGCTMEGTLEEVEDKIISTLIRYL